MPFETKLDMYGSSLTVAYNNATRSRRVRLCRLRDLEQAVFDGTNADFRKAVNQFEASEGTFDPDGAIPLSGVTTTRFGPYTMLATALYAFPHGTGIGGSISQSYVASYAASSSGARVFRSSFLTDANGDQSPNFDQDDAETPPETQQDPQNTYLPWGDVTRLKDGGDPVSRIVKRPTVDVEIYTKLPFNPLGTPYNVGFFVDKVNNSNIIIGQHAQFPGTVVPEMPGILGPESVLCKGPIVVQTTDPLTPFEVRYRFEIISGKWYEQVPTVSTQTGALQIDNVPMYLATSFSGAFPINPYTFGGSG